MDISQLHGQLYNIGKEYEGTGRKDNLIPQNSRETQSLFQTVKM